ncbi:Endo-beta-1,4-glucanase [Alteracholeplasma palmae J233]|uniref:Endo-beta-1,4-glucanase n=1 Tax=Alteracholeplasma palmae (strain ATCC 49389 / J233) TaxID=1318466 RepID=U4KKW7_ALTPJ|nr:M42 family metallopeptidase [Alteracholeplasma palmae]CCV64352.1 Endo-beta-1,4-glucanase [Alteracholeplasma palmae J233]
MDLLKTLKDLSTLNGVPGNEKDVSRYVVENIKNTVDEVNFDNLGSVIAKKGTKGPKVMIAGHMDEVGLMVTQITKEGFVKFQPLGGWFSQVMLAQVWQIHTKKGVIFAVTGVKPPHLIPASERSKAIEISSMYLDLGAKTKEEVLELGVSIGDTITPYTEFRELGNKDYLLGKAWDNRVGSAVVMHVLSELGKNDKNQLYGTFTVQEEVGLRGAKTSSYKVHPQIAIAVDTGVGNDVPGGDPVEQTLGNGPQILIYDGGLIAHKGLRDFVINIAKENNIPYQEAYITGGRTDAGNMHLAHEGAASLSICIPTRYMHSHTSIIHKQDVLNTIKLLKLVVERLDEETVNRLLYQD